MVYIPKFDRDIKIREMSAEERREYDRLRARKCYYNKQGRLDKWELTEGARQAGLHGLIPRKYRKAEPEVQQILERLAALELLVRELLDSLNKPKSVC